MGEQTRPTGPARPAPSGDPLAPVGPGLETAGLRPAPALGEGTLYIGNEVFSYDSRRQSLSTPDGDVVRSGAVLTDRRTGQTGLYVGTSISGGGLAFAGDPNTQGFVAAGTLTNGVDRLSLGVAGSPATGAYQGFGSLRLDDVQFDLRAVRTATGTGGGATATWHGDAGRSASAGLQYDPDGTWRLSGGVNGGEQGPRVDGTVTLRPGHRAGVDVRASMPIDQALRVGGNASVGTDGAYAIGANVRYNLSEQITAEGSIGHRRDASGRNVTEGSGSIGYTSPRDGISAGLRGSYNSEGEASLMFRFNIPLGPRGPSGRGDQRSAVELPLPRPLDPGAPGAQDPATPGQAPRAVAAAPTGPTSSLLDGLLAGDPEAMARARNHPASQDMRRQAVAEVDAQQAATQAQTQAQTPDRNPSPASPPSHGARSLA